MSVHTLVRVEALALKSRHAADGLGAHRRMLFRQHRSKCFDWHTPALMRVAALALKSRHALRTALENGGGPHLQQHGTHTRSTVFVSAWRQSDLQQQQRVRGCFSGTATGSLHRWRDSHKDADCLPRVVVCNIADDLGPIGPPKLRHHL